MKYKEPEESSLPSGDTFTTEKPKPKEPEETSQTRDVTLLKLEGKRMPPRRQPSEEARSMP
jgi:hypothetical protein